MGRSRNNILANWEKLIFWVMLLIFIGFLISVVIKLSRGRKDPRLAAKQVPRPKPLLSDSAYAFLHGITLPGPDENPFAGKKTFAKPHIKRPPLKNGPKWKLPPKKPKKFHLYEYTGWVESAGKKMAFMKIVDSKTRRIVRSATLQIGGRIGTMTICRIENEKIVVKDSQGHELFIPIHKNLKVQIK